VYVHFYFKEMLAKAFYLIIQSKETILSFFKEKGFIVDDNDLPPCVICGYETKFYTRKERGKDRKVIRCRRKGGQKMQPVRKGNTFFNIQG